MTAKEKAKELVERFQYKGIYITDVRMSEECAIESALICVDEMLAFDLRFFDIEFLKEVKQEIEKL